MAYIVYHWQLDLPDDPDADAFRAEIEDWKRSYLCYRGQFGWGVFLLTGKQMKAAAWSVDDAG